MTIDSDALFFNSVTSKVLSYKAGQYRTVGVFNEFSTGIVFDSGGLPELTFDSTFNFLVDRPSPIVTLSVQDDSGNNITWSVTQTPASPNNIKLISAAGGQPPYTLSPIINDSSFIGATTDFNFTGKISTGVNGGNPVIVPTDPADPYPSNERINVSLKWTDNLVIMTGFNHEDVTRYFNVGTPAIRLVKSSPVLNETEPRGLNFNPTGSRAYFGGRASKAIKQISLSTNYKAGSGTDDSSYNPNLTFIGNDINGAYVNDSENRAYMLDGTYVYQFNLDSVGKISTAQYKSPSYDHASIIRSGQVSENGKFFFSLDNDNNIRKWEISQDHKIYTTSYTHVATKQVDKHIDFKFAFSHYYFSFTGFRYIRLAAYANFPHVGNTTAFTISSDGLTMYTATGIGYDKGQIYKYTMSEPWDIANATLDQSTDHHIGQRGSDVLASPRAQSLDIGISAMKISNDGSKLYLLDRYYSQVTVVVSRNGAANTYYSNNVKPKIYQYTLSSTNDIDSLEDQTKFTLTLSNIPVSSPGAWPTYAATNPNFNHYIAGFDFNDNGSKFYISTHQGIYEYSSSNFDITSTATTGSLVVTGSTDTTTKGLTVIGNHLYIQNNQKVIQKDFTSQNLSSMSSDTEKFVLISSAENQPKAIAFKSDESKFYIIGSENRNIQEFTVATPGEISTATHTGTASSANTLSDPTSLSLNAAENTIQAGNLGSIYEFAVDSPFSSTAFNSTLFNITGNATVMKGFAWNSTGSAFTIVGTSDASFDEFETNNNYRVLPL